MRRMSAAIQLTDDPSPVRPRAARNHAQDRMEQRAEKCQGEGTLAQQSPPASPICARTATGNYELRGATRSDGLEGGRI